jgi:hypothetical protein
MQTNQPPPLTRQRIDAFHASALRWLGRLMRLILTLGTPGRGQRLRRFLTRIELEVECRLALFFKRAGVRARRQNALTRVLRLFDVLAKPERFIAYFLKRLCKGLRMSALVASAPPAHALACGAPTRVTFTDSS